MWNYAKSGKSSFYHFCPEGAQKSIKIIYLHAFRFYLDCILLLIN